MSDDFTRRLRRMLERDEGVRLKPYRCSEGKLTIGIGRNLDDVGLTQQEVYQLLDNDVKRAEQACLSVFGEAQWGRWSEVRRLGWINFAFNLGPSGVLGFRNTLRAAIGENWDEVERHLRKSKWATQVKSRADRVIAMICREEFPYA